MRLKQQFLDGRCPDTLYTACTYALFLRTQHHFFLCPAKVAKRRVGAR